MGLTTHEEYHLIALGNNGWLTVSNSNAADNGTAGTPDGNTGVALHTLGAIFATEGASCSSAYANISAGSFLCPDNGIHEWLGVTNGAAVAIFGMMALVSSATIASVDKTAAIITATLCAASASNCNQAGDYTVEWAFSETGTACATPGTGGVTFLLTWTDQNGTAHSAISLPMDDSASLVATSGTFTFRTTLGAAWASGNFNISSNGSIIQYATGYTACGVGTGTYQLDAWVTRKE